jgi:hypothetical protein
MPTPAERDCCAPAQTEFLAILIDDRKVAFHAQWAVIENCDFCSSQGFLRIQNLSRVLETISKITGRMEKHKRVLEETPE